MTKKHYEAIADDIARTRRVIHSNDYYIIDALAQALAITFMQDNPRFDRKKFLAACGIKQ